jgi:hypothetical protein
MQTTNEKLRKKITKSYKKNETAGTIDIKYFSGKTKQEIIFIMQIMVDLARISNADISVRIKALAMIKFFNIVCPDTVVNDRASFYCARYIKDIDGIESIIEENCLEIINSISEKNDNKFRTDFEFFYLIEEVIGNLDYYTISTNIFNEFYDSIVGIKEEAKSEYSYIYSILKKIKQEYDS